MNPECAAGKHPNCDGKAWRDDLDAIGPCQCGCHEVAMFAGHAYGCAFPARGAACDCGLADAVLPWEDLGEQT
jgi:hypothetical protein